jgi:hypothetical protein
LPNIKIFTSKLPNIKMKTSPIMYISWPNTMYNVLGYPLTPAAGT